MKLLAVVSGLFLSLVPAFGDEGDYEKVMAYIEKNLIGKDFVATIDHEIPGSNVYSKFRRSFK